MHYATNMPAIFMKYTRDIYLFLVTNLLKTTLLYYKIIKKKICLNILRDKINIDSLS